MYLCLGYSGGPHAHHHFVPVVLEISWLLMRSLSPGVRAARLIRWCVLRGACLGDTSLNHAGLGKYEGKDVAALAGWSCP